MALTYRLVKGIPLTFKEGDDNLSYLEGLALSGSTINTGSFATTGSNNFSGNQYILGSLLINGNSVISSNQTSSMSVLSSSFSLSSSYYKETDPIFVSKSSSLATTGSNNFLGSQYISGSVILGDKNSTISGSSNIINAQSDIVAFSSQSVNRIEFNYPTTSIGYSTGISEDKRTIYKFLTSSVLGVATFTVSSNLQNSTYRLATDAIGYPITDYKFVLNNSDIVTYKGNATFSTASFTNTGSFASSSYISGAAVVSYSLSNPLPDQVGLSGSQITHITFAKSSSLAYINLGTSSLGKVYEGYIDDIPIIPVATTFPINFLGRQYSTIYVTGNGHIMFDNRTNATNAFYVPIGSSSIPPIPNIKVGASDLSLYRVYTGSDASTFRLWIQERSDWQNGTPDREYSYIFYKGSERVDLQIDKMVLSSRSITPINQVQKVSQISDGYTLFSDFSSSIYSGSGYAVNIWEPPVTSSTVKVKQISGNTITAYGSASIDPGLVGSDLYYISLEKRPSTSSLYSTTAYSIRNTGSLQNLKISSVSYNSGVDETTISLLSSIQGDYTASIFSSSYVGMWSNNYIDTPVSSISGSTISINNPNSDFYEFLSFPLTASSVVLYKSDGYSKNILLNSTYYRNGFRIISSSFSGDLTGNLFISYSVLPLGSYTSAVFGEYSQAFGLGVVASSSYQYVFGKYNNLNDITSTFVIGGGTSAIDRKNLLSVNDTTVSIIGDLSYASSSLLISKNGSTFSSSISLNGYLSVLSSASASYFKGSGSSILKVSGYYSDHVIVEDDLVSGSYSSSIFSVNDLMGIPVISAFYDGAVRMYNYPDTIFEKSGSSIYLGTNYTTESKAVIRSNFTIDKGSGLQYNMTQATGSTIGSITSSIYTYYFDGSKSSSLYYNAIINGYDTGSREIIIGDIKSTIKFAAGAASIIGTNTKSAISESVGLGFNIVAGGTSASLEVYGIPNKIYRWAATVTTQNF